MVLCCGLKLAPRCVGSGTSWEGLRCRPRSGDPGTPGRKYKVICSLQLPMLGFEAAGKDCASMSARLGAT